MSPAQRLRFAPSPTGYLHIGGARTALFNWLYARKHQGVFVLRIEDTDQVRSTPASLKAILDALEWLGIDWDEGPERAGALGPYFQAQRMELYRDWATQLIAQKKAYRCYCTREELEQRRAKAKSDKGEYKYEGTCRDRPDEPGRPHVVRFRMPEGSGEVAFEDLVLGRIAKEHSDLDDWVMVRGDGMPLYNFACVIDDHLMEMTLVGRGQEHVNSTFPQLMLYKALGWEPPRFAHFPLIMSQGREKLSKRKHPEADVMEHAKNGILPEALCNFVMRLGWAHGNDEVITREQLIEWFGFEGVGTTSGVWNPDKLLWLNQQWMKQLPLEEVTRRAIPFFEELGFRVNGDPRLPKVVAALRERAQTLKEMARMGAYFFSEGVTLDEKAAGKHVTAETAPLLRAAKETLEGLGGWETVKIDEALKQVSEKAGVGMGKIAQPLRVAVTGNTASPGIGETLELVGRDESLRRITAALARAG